MPNTRWIPLAVALGLMGCTGEELVESETTDPTTGESLDQAPPEVDTDFPTFPVDTDTPDTDVMAMSILEIVTNTDRFSILEAAVGRAGLTSALQGTGLTVFAPNDTAFNNAGVTSADDLTPVQLEYILKYHVLGSEVDAAAAIGVAQGSDPTAAALGGTLDLSYDSGTMTLSVDGADVIQADIDASNGVIHEIDAVLLPSITDVVVSDAGFSQLETAVGTASLAELLDGENPASGSDGKFTVFAPTDAAFGALVTALSGNSSTGITGPADFSADQLDPILRYHVLDGEVDSTTAVGLAQGSDPTAATLGGTIDLSYDGGTMTLSVDDADVTVTDILTSNGTIHVIDAVMLPSITDIASSSDDFEELTNAVVTADLADLLDGENPASGSGGQFTVFAPDDTAFVDLVTALAANASTGITGPVDFTADQLDPILRYHVVDGAVYALDVSAGDVTTLGGTAELGTTGGVFIDDAEVVVTDIFAANGVIHVIDAVLLPSVTDLVTTHPDFTLLTEAVSSVTGLAGLLDAGNAASGSGGNFTVLAPDDAAFGNLVSFVNNNTSLTVTGVSSFNETALDSILRYHVLDGAVYAADVPDADVTTLGGTVAAASTGGVSFDGASVSVANLFVENGVIHVLEDVLLPSITDIASTNPVFTELTRAVVAADFAALLDGVNPASGSDGLFTVFAPTDAAFGDLITAVDSTTPLSPTAADDFTVAQLDPILRYHVLDGGVYSPDVAAGDVTTLGGTATISTTSGPMIDAANIAVTDVLASNGVIHVIDAVLLPSITDIVTTDPDLTLLTDAVIAVDGAVSPSPDLVGTLDSTPNLTLFAPVDSAFSDLVTANGLGDLDGLVSALTAQGVLDVLEYHVYGGRLSPVFADEAALLAAGGPAPLTMLSGDDATVSLNVLDLVLNDGVDGGFNASNTSLVETADILAENGVIHKIGTVILPAIPD